MKLQTTVTVKIYDDGTNDVDISGEHLAKQRLLRVIKALKVGHRLKIKEYRKQFITERTKKDARYKETIRDTGTGKSESGATSGSKSGPKSKS
ncbi:MAG: hypothetical protein ACTSYW_02605 [Candidatus Heimdallarchaeota archaeon]